MKYELRGITGDDSLDDSVIVLSRKHQIVGNEVVVAQHGLALSVERGAGRLTQAQKSETNKCNVFPRPARLAETQTGC